MDLDQVLRSGYVESFAGSSFGSPRLLCKEEETTRTTLEPCYIEQSCGRSDAIVGNLNGNVPVVGAGFLGGSYKLILMGNSVTMMPVTLYFEPSALIVQEVL